jgi:hypothetical protein
MTFEYPILCWHAGLAWRPECTFLLNHCSSTTPNSRRPNLNKFPQWLTCNQLEHVIHSLPHLQQRSRSSGQGGGYGGADSHKQALSHQATRGVINMLVGSLGQVAVQGMGAASRSI